jgi:hypothetical protein
MPPRPAWSTFGPHPIGAERFVTVSSGKSFAQVAGTILRKQAQGQNPDKDEVSSECSSALGSDRVLAVDRAARKGAPWKAGAGRRWWRWD